MSDTTALGIKLSDLWYDEQCVWRMDFDSGAGTDSPWIVLLEWTQEFGNEHHADWVTFTWQFYGDTVEEALHDAVAWCKGLLPFKRCGACDGEGAYNRRADERVTCEDCGGSGLDSDVKTEDATA